MATANLTVLDETLSGLSAHVTATFGDAVQAEVAYGELSFETNAQHILALLHFLRDDPACGFVSFIDLCGVDYPARELRFDVVYHLLSPRKNARIRIRLQTDSAKLVPSCTEIFPGALWFEREAYDLFGILFTGHPDMRRLLTDYGFDGHPLRKDFPLTGFVEVRWDDQEKRVLYEPVRLSQEFRQFDFLSPWEGVDYQLPGDEKAKAG